MSERKRNTPGLESQVVMWRTPAVQDPGIKVERLTGELGGRMYDKETGRNAQYGLQQQVNWPTPNTRCASNGINESGGQRNTPEFGRSDTILKGCKNWPIPNSPKGQFKLGTKLNPSWVSQLMGLSVGWTQLSGVTDPHENRIDRLRLLGNGVVPQTAEKAFRTLIDKVLTEEKC